MAGSYQDQQALVGLLLLADDSSEDDQEVQHRLLEEYLVALTADEQIFVFHFGATCDQLYDGLN